MTQSNRRTRNEYPYFIVQAWGGRLATPPEYRGTPIAKQFESGRIGGRKLTVDEELSDTPEGREEVLRLVRQHRDAEVFYVRSHTSSRQRLGTAPLYRASFVSDGLLLA